MNIFKGKTVLLLGGTGSFGQKLAKTILSEGSPEKLIVYSRDELKQYEMKQRFSQYENMRFFIGDIRDKERLMRAFHGVDYVLHLSALKQIPAMEYNPTEAIKTNILGTMNIIEAALDREVKRVIAVSTVKACNPICLYGATKLCADKLLVAANSYAGSSDTKFAVVRFGNIIGSRGGVVAFFKEKRKTGKLPITDPNMTRFWITPEIGVHFITKCLGRMKGGEIFVPKLPSMNIMDLARAVAPECKTEVVGIRPGEKLNEIMISEDDARNTIELDDCYVIQPVFHWWRADNHKAGKPVPPSFKYSSDTNREKLTVAQLQEIISEQ